MTTGSVLAIDLAIAVLAAAGWLGGGAALAAGRRQLAFTLGALALLATLARAITIVALARAGWWFAADKVLIAAPFAIVSLIVAFRRRFLFAGYLQTSALIVTVLHGYPPTPASALLAMGAVATATAVSLRQPAHRPHRTVAFFVAGAAILAGIGLGVGPSAGSGVLHKHDYGSAQSVGEPTKRYTLTAAHQGAAWAFNGQVPGPALTATVGDVIEVTLRNRDIEEGVTLHWHGYDVPNSQDGVPGVTQDAVLPGQEFVYRFRADRAGTYWYHTHSASDLGVRKGLYGAFVVRAAPVTGVDLTLPAHAPSKVDRLEAGVPVRLRLINTDSATHRYALAGSAFRVAAIDGYDLSGPTAVQNMALSIPAGGRADLVFTAPGTPVSLVEDGRAVYSTGSVSISTASWPVLDPLAYGAAAPVPWSHFDKEFTLVLDRGLDLHGLVPRYAHTVNGAADPDIPVQLVHVGDIVKFRIVNRSLSVHPWHLHGHHVLVLSRNGKPATGSPLWLDSFDVRPGEVWEVAFAANNPGMWANHCHNLAHADAGMMLHLMYS